MEVSDLLTVSTQPAVGMKKVKVDGSHGPHVLLSRQCRVV